MDEDATPSEQVTALAAQEGWRSEGPAARVHYRGETETYSIEYYATTGVVLYWRVEEDFAAPVDRETVPGPLRERVRQDLAEADVDPAVERASV